MNYEFPSAPPISRHCFWVDGWTDLVFLVGGFAKAKLSG